MIASLTDCATKQGIRSVMVTGDKDLLQLVDEHVSALRPPKKGESRYRLVGPAEVLEEYGIRADQVIDYLALIGDSSDNVPGVAGIGPKGAVKLLQEHGDLDGVYRNLEGLSPSVAKKLSEARQMAYLSRTLVALRHDVVDVTDFHTEQFRMDCVDWQKAVPLFEQANAKSLVNANQLRSEECLWCDRAPKVGSSWSKPGTYHAVTDLGKLAELLDLMADGGIMASISRRPLSTRW